MNAEEARKTIQANKAFIKAVYRGDDKWPTEAESISVSDGWKLQYKHALNGMGEVVAFAKGYLEALNGPEVASLVAALNRIEEAGQYEEAFYGDLQEWARKALSAFRAAVHSNDSERGKE